MLNTNLEWKSAVKSLKVREANKDSVHRGICGMYFHGLGLRISHHSSV